MSPTQTADNQGRAGVNPDASGMLPNRQQVRSNPASGSGGSSQQRQPDAQIAVGAQPERALVAVAEAENPGIGGNTKTFGAQIARLPVELDVSIPLRDFRVRDLLALEPGRLVESEWSNGVDLPLAAGEVQLAWTEFEVIETDLVVRLTRLA